LRFCAYANENVTKLGPDTYSAHPFGVVNEQAIKEGIVRPVMEHDAKLTPDFRKLQEEKREAYVKSYVDTRLKAYLEKNVFISAIRFPKNTAGVAPKSEAK
jgi:hypothetical protein